MALLHCLGASQEVGRSAFMLDTDRRILLDYGIKVFDLSGHPKYPIDIGMMPDIALISHAHLDHSGFVPALYKGGSSLRWFATPPTRAVCEVLWKDSMKIMGDELPYGAAHFQRALRHWIPLRYNQMMRIGETEFRFLDAGHIIGSAMIELVYKNRTILYTGDFKIESTRMHNGAKPVEDVQTIIIDSTYGMREHPDRKRLEEQLADEINETINDGGSVLLPAFSLGRTQELISVVRAYNRNVPVFVDGMGREITRIYLKHQKYIKEPARFRKDVESVWLIASPQERKRVVHTPSVIISSAGMMEGGPALNYLFELNPYSKVIFTGFNVEGTNGWKLLNKGYITVNGRDLEVGLPAQYFDLSAHAGKSDLLNFIKWANPEKIVIVHTDVGKEFERELREDFGYDAIAPKVGDVIEL